jgi:hypothetical protein
MGTIQQENEQEDLIILDDSDDLVTDSTDESELINLEDDSSNDTIELINLEDDDTSDIIEL